MYSPLYFLAALGAGGLAVSFFLMLMFWIPHPGQQIPVFEDWVSAFQTGDLLTQAIVVVGLSGVLFFTVQHIRLLILNFQLMGTFRRSPEYARFLASPMQTQELALPLASAMAINVGFIAGALFVPKLWTIVEVLFPFAMVAFLAIGIWALALYARVFRQATSGAFDIGGTESFAQVLPAFSFAMVAVGLAAPASMSHTPWVVGISVTFSTFFAVTAIVLAVLKTAMALSNMLTKGVDPAGLPTLWIWVPILTVLAITLMRQDHGVVHTLGLGVQTAWLSPLLMVVSAQVLVLILGTVAMHPHDYLAKVWNGEVKGAAVFALICPGVALSVSLHFLINKGFVASGLVSHGGIAYGLLNLMPMAIMVLTIVAFLRLLRSFTIERAQWASAQLSNAHS